jgi:hypothetical protein
MEITLYVINLNYIFKFTFWQFLGIRFNLFFTYEILSSFNLYYQVSVLSPFIVVCIVTFIVVYNFKVQTIVA